MLQLSYYDDRGLIVTDKMWCVFHYLTRGFCLDVIGALPWFEVLRGVPSEHIDDDTTMLMNTVCKFAHLYIILGYFDYIGDAPNVIAFFKILKWQLVSILVMFGTSHFLVYHCVDYTFDAKLNLVGMARRNECWLPKFLELQPEPTVGQLHVILKWQLVSILVMFGTSHFLVYHCVDYTFDAKLNLVGMARRNECWLPKFLELQPEPTVEQLHVGCIFGQLNSASNHPVRVSAISDGYADLLQIHVKQFQGIIDDEIRKHIAQNPQSKDDYMATKKHIVEDPYDTIQYILCGRKTIKLPVSIITTYLVWSKPF
ncbi:hypothetical protein OBRU01_23987 [Operophtera brumata]|uniref:Uncharacterized protein n=1 Tax=Operophtera brumata TaxID=104452 RepID=A0A0L7KMR6_OPEBR|nr:hypothetical protein OBRU01_23987 [Operophtera brumata]